MEWLDTTALGLLLPAGFVRPGIGTLRVDPGHGREVRPGLILQAFPVAPDAQRPLPVGGVRGAESSSVVLGQEGIGLEPVGDGLDRCVSYLLPSDPPGSGTPPAGTWDLGTQTACPTPSSADGTPFLSRLMNPHGRSG